MVDYSLVFFCACDIHIWSGDKERRWLQRDGENKEAARPSGCAGRKIKDKQANKQWRWFFFGGVGGDRDGDGSTRRPTSTASQRLPDGRRRRRRRRHTIADDCFGLFLRRTSVIRCDVVVYSVRFWCRIQLSMTQTVYDFYSALVTSLVKSYSDKHPWVWHSFVSQSVGCYCLHYHTIFIISSVSKVCTSLLIMNLSV